MQTADKELTILFAPTSLAFPEKYVHPYHHFQGQLSVYKTTVFFFLKKNKTDSYLVFPPLKNDFLCFFLWRLHQFLFSFELCDCFCLFKFDDLLTGWGGTDDLDSLLGKLSWKYPVLSLILSCYSGCTCFLL